MVVPSARSPYRAKAGYQEFRVIIIMIQSGRLRVAYPV